MKRITIFSFYVILGLSLIAAVPAGAEMVFKLAMVTPPGHAYSAGAQEFARLVNEGTGGEVVVRVYAGGQIAGSESELLEAVHTGNIDMAITSTGPVSYFNPGMGVADLPFLFTDYSGVDRVFDGPVGRELLDGLESANMKGLAFFENGFRHFTNSIRPLLRPEDFRGLKFRTMENPVHLASVRELGAQAIPMSWEGAYASLQSKAIDGQENPIAIIHAYKLSEVQKYLSLTGHFYSPSPMSMNLKKFMKLKTEWQKLFLEAAARAAKFERKLIRDSESKQLEEIRAQGMIIDTVDKDVFVKAMSPVYEMFYDKYPAWKETVKKIRSEQ